MNSQHFDKNNPHHAYLVEGLKEEILPKIYDFVESMGFKIKNNPDLYNISLDTFKIEDANNLRSFQYEKSILGGKKIYIISADIFLLEAQNTLLKIFEEPTLDTHFFIIVPDLEIFLPTIFSRCRVVRSNLKLKADWQNAENFIKMTPKNRVEFLKNFVKTDDKDNDESVRLRALKFLNALESILHEHLSGNIKLSSSIFGQIWKVREFVKQPGSSIKNLLEYLALIVPEF